MKIRLTRITHDCQGDLGLILPMSVKWGFDPDGFISRVSEITLIVVAATLGGMFMNMRRMEASGGRSQKGWV